MVKLQPWCHIATTAAVIVATACTPPPPDEAGYVERLLEDRAIKNEMFAQGQDSPVPLDRRSWMLPIRYYEPAASYRVPASLNIAEDRPTFEIPTSTGQLRTMQRVGTLEFMLNGETRTLSALVELPGGVKVAALIAVNAVGDIHDPNTGAIIAGARTEDGRRFIGTRKLLRESMNSETRGGTNTTIGVVMTNVVLDPAQLGVVARMAQSGLARTVRPAHTPADGDTIFALSTGTLRNDAGLLRIGAFAADVTADAIVRAVKAATSIPGYPASRDLKENTQ